MSSTKETINLIMPSDACLDIYPENRASNFTVQFDKTINLGERMLCVLSDIILPEPAEYFDQLKIDFLICEEYSKYRQIWGKSMNVIYSIKFDEVYLHDRRKWIRDMVKKIKDDDINSIIKNELIKNRGFKQVSVLQEFKIDYDFDLNKFSFENYKSQSSEQDEQIFYDPEKVTVLIDFDENLFKLLNIDKELKIPKNLNFVSDNRQQNLYKISFPVHGVNLFETSNSDYFISEPILKEAISTKNSELIHDFFILCNIITDSYINNVKYKFLKYGHCDSNGRLFMNFKTLQYFPIISYEINEINFRILDKNLNELYFQNGTLIIVLKIISSE